MVRGCVRAVTPLLLAALLVGAPAGLAAATEPAATSTTASFTAVGFTAVGFNAVGSLAVTDQEELDEAYREWEKRYSEMAAAELERRLAAQERYARTMQITQEYLEFEAQHAALARAELERRAKDNEEAREELARAEAAKAEADRKAQEAQAAEQKKAQEEALRAEADRVAAEKKQQEAQAAEDAAKAKAEEEARQKQAMEQEAIRQHHAEEQQAQEEAQKVEPVEETTRWTTSDVNVRSGPGTGYEKLGSLPPNTAITVNGSASGYWRLTDGTFVSQHYTRDTEQPPAAPPPAAEPAPQQESSFAWQTYVSNVDGQAAVDQCRGGLTYSEEISAAIGKAYYAMHIHCGGAPILSLETGQRVYIDGVGAFKVVDSRTVSVSATTADLSGLGGSAVLQTCYSDNARMRVVAISPI